MRHREQTISLTGQADCIRRQITRVRSATKDLRPSEIAYEVGALEAALETIVGLQTQREAERKVLGGLSDIERTGMDL